MPSYWYSYRDNKVTDDDDVGTIKKKEFNKSIVAATKPYFMTYVYPSLKKQNNLYEKNNTQGVARRFWEYGIYTIQDLEAYPNKTDEMTEYLVYYHKFRPIGVRDCIVNRICRLFERTFSGYLSKKYEQPTFDYKILKSNVGYNKAEYKKIKEIYNDYLDDIGQFMQKAKTQKIDEYELWMQREVSRQFFQSECENICPNEDELCDIILDMVYKTEKSKQFAWDIVGDVMVKNLLRETNGKIQFPVTAGTCCDFQYCGVNFNMNTKVIGGDSVDYFE